MSEERFRKLSNVVFYLAFSSFLVNISSNFLKFFSVLNSPEEYSITSLSDLWVYFLYIYLLYWLRRNNRFAQVLYALFALINVLTLKIIFEEYSMSFEHFIYSLGFEVLLSSSAGILILIKLSLGLIKKLKD